MPKTKILIFLFIILFTTSAYADRQACVDAKDAKKWDRVEEVCAPVAKKGDAVAQLIMAQKLLRGRNAALDDLGDVVEWLKKSVKGDSVYAPTVLGNIYCVNQKVQNYKSAKEMYHRSAALGEPEAQGRLSKAYLFGQCGFPKENYKSYVWGRLALSGPYKQHAHLDSGLVKKSKSSLSKSEIARAEKVVAAWKLGQLPDFSDRPDENVFIADLRKKAEQGDDKAQFDLAKAYMKGEGLAKPDKEQAIIWLNKAAENGNVDAMLQLGLRHLYSPDKPGVLFSDKEGVDKAVVWLEKAADKGNSYAKLQLGRIYYYANQERKAEQQLVASINGKEDSRTSITSDQTIHTSLKRDPKKALPLLLGAAEVGEVEALPMLVQIYSDGESVPVDVVEAYKWIVLMSDRGILNNTAEAEKKMEEKFGREAISKAKQRAAEWKKKYPAWK